MIVVCEGWKFCRDCRQFKRLTKTNFYRSKWWDSACRKCRRKRSAERDARLKREAEADPKLLAARRELARLKSAERRAKHPERQRQLRKDRWQRDRAKYETDPKAKAVHLQDRRILNTLRDGRVVKKGEGTKAFATEAYRRSPVRGEQLDPEPLLEFLRTTFPGLPVNAIAQRTGMRERTMRGILNREFLTVSLTLADRVFTNYGRPDLLQTYYPLED